MKILYSKILKMFHVKQYRKNKYKKDNLKNKWAVYDLKK